MKRTPLLLLHLALFVLAACADDDPTGLASGAIDTGAADNDAGSDGGGDQDAAGIEDGGTGVEDTGGGQDSSDEADTDEVGDGGGQDVGGIEDGGGDPDAGGTDDTGASQDADPNPVTVGVVLINEIVAAGDPDWFEIYNPGSQTFDLSQLTFVDGVEFDESVPLPLEDMMLPAGGFVRVDVSDENVGFKLGGDEDVSLFGPDGLVVDYVDWQEGDSPSDQSYGRLPDGGETLQTLSTQTPGESNIE